MANLIAFLISPAILIYNALIHSAMSEHLSKTDCDKKTGIIRGAEPVYLKGANSTAILMVHGYIGSPTDFANLPETLNRLGYTVSAPLLPGHGRDPRDFSKTTSKQLIDFVSAEYQKLEKTHKETVVIGFSMGGALATLLAQQHSVQRLILLAPYYEIAQQWYYLFPVEAYSKVFSAHVPYVYRPRCFKQVNDKIDTEKIIDYSFISTKGSQAVIELGEMSRKAASTIKAETLVIHSKKDKATDYRTAKNVTANFACEAKFLSLEKSNHMILWDYDSSLVKHEIIKFITKEG